MNRNEQEALICERLKQLRESVQMNKKQLAATLGFSDVAIGLWETGKRQITGQPLRSYADYFDVSVDWLLGRTDKKEINR